MDLYRSDVPNRQCPSGSCRFGRYVLSLLGHNDLADYQYPKWLEDNLALEIEEQERRPAMESFSSIPQGRVFFAEELACICRMSEQLLNERSS